MKEMLRSKVIVVFVLMVLGVIFVDSSITVKLEESTESYNKRVIAANIK